MTAKSVSKKYSVRSFLSGLFNTADSPPEAVVASILGYAPTATAGLKLSTASRCISLISGAFASADVTLYRHSADGSPEAAVGHPLYDAMLNGTADLSAYELKAALMESFVSHGEAFAVVSFDSQGRLTNIAPQAWENVQVEVLGNGRMQYRLSDPLRNYVQTIYSSNDMLHAKWRPGPDGRGRSPLQLAALSMGIAADIEESVAQDARSGWRASGILTAPGAIGDESAKRLKETFESRYMGPNGAGKIAVVGDGLKFDRFTLSNSDNEVLENRRLNAYMVAQAYGVPPDVAGLPFHSTWSSASEANRQFVNLAAEVWSQALCQQICAFVLGSRERRSLYLAADWRALISGSLQERAAAYATLAKSGIMTSNEIRKTFDLKPLPGGDVLVVATSSQPADAVTPPVAEAQP